MSVRSRSAARKVALSVRASRIVDSRAFARGWSTTRTSMVMSLSDTVRLEGPETSWSPRRGAPDGVSAPSLIGPSPGPAVVSGPGAILQHRGARAGRGEARHHDLVRRGVDPQDAAEQRGPPGLDQGGWRIAGQHLPGRRQRVDLARGAPGPGGDVGGGRGRPR